MGCYHPPMKLLFTRFPLASSLTGGAEQQTMSLMRGLMDRGHAVAFAGSCPALLERTKAEGMIATRYAVGAPPVTKWGAISFLWRKRAMRRKLSQLLAQFHDLDAIIMLSLTEKLLLTDIAVARGIRVFWIEHDRIGRWLTGNPWLPLLTRQAAHATTITVSTLSKKMYLDLGWPEDRTMAVTNGVAISDKRVANSIHPSHSPLPATRYPLRLGCVARLSPEKGVDLLIEAVADLPTIALTIVGKGKEEKRLRTILQRTQNTRIIPAVENLSVFYDSLDILILPSRDHDPFGLVAAEAMMRGIPVIVTDACGIAGYLRSGLDAVVVPANSTSALREAIILLTDETIRTQMWQEGRKTAEKIFGVSRMIDNYEKVFNVSCIGRS